ncbi:MAG: nitrous oxide reductase family maturation protein NosD [Trueperaceae bacterium]|nr:nitrous oxide reductase family maturation protein NosD [Trueperaceae bacterium]
MSAPRLHAFWRSAGRAAALAALLVLALPHARAAELDVCSTGCAYSTIASALAASQDGDVVTVHAGTYREGPLVIDKSISLLGSAEPVLDGELQHQILLITADHVAVRGFVFKDAGRSRIREISAVKAENVGGCIIEDNRIDNAFFGIYLARATACEVRRNAIHGEAENEAFSGNAIHIWNGHSIVVEDNIMTGHRDGLYLEFARANVARRNVSRGNIRYGLHFMFSNDSEFSDNVFSHNDAGVAVMYSKEITMIGNEFSDNWGAAAYGLLLKDINDSIVSGNLFQNNTAGVYLDGSSRTELSHNEFIQNGYAMRVLANSMGSIVRYNNFIGNTFDVVTNSNRSYNSFMENYWDAYEGYDLDKDGIGDVPYRPVRLFALTVEWYPQSLVLLRSPLSQVMDYAERLMPVITPKAIEDDRPLMGRIRWSSSTH